MRSRVIGGEFEIKSMPSSNHWKSGSGYYRYASGRAALYQILMSIKHTTLKVWLPDWLCESIIDAVRRTGLTYDFYPLGLDLRMDVKRFIGESRLVSENDVILLVNYFGLVDIEGTIEALRTHKVESIIIEDDVQALFSFFDNTFHSADYRFTSLRKSIAVPDGGLVKTRRPMPTVTKENTFTRYKLQGALKKGSTVDSSNDEAYLSLLKKGEYLVENNYDSVMSNESESLLANIDLKIVAEKRKNNAQYLITELFKLGLEPLMHIKENHVPLFVPILIDHRDEVRNALFKCGIFCPVHWPLREDMVHLFTGKIMKKKELSLVVDQRYNQEDMRCIVQVLKDNLWKLK